MSAPARDPRLAAIRQRDSRDRVVLGCSDRGRRLRFQQAREDRAWLLARVEALETAMTTIAGELEASAEIGWPVEKWAQLWARKLKAALAPPPGGTP